MAGGGQKGVGGIEFAGAMMILLGFIGGCTARGWLDGQESDPMSQHQTACMEAWSAKEQGKADGDDLVLLDTSFCQQHNAAAITEEQMEDRTDVQEATP